MLCKVIIVVNKLFILIIAEFPNCVGAVDGTQIPIIAPWKNDEQYINYHRFHSILVMIVVNHRGAITYLSARWPGATHNS